MIKFLKDKFGPVNCDDDTMMKRMYRAATVSRWTNFYACCGSWSIMASAVAGLAMIAGLPGIIPLVLLGGGAMVLGSSIPLLKLTDKIESAFTGECRKRGLWKPEWDNPPDPAEAYEAARAAERAPVAIPVLADIFDPAAAVTLGNDVKTMRSIKLKPRPHFMGYRA